MLVYRYYSARVKGDLKCGLALTHLHTHARTHAHTHTHTHTHVCKINAFEVHIILTCLTDRKTFILNLFVYFGIVFSSEGMKEGRAVPKASCFK